MIEDTRPIPYSLRLEPETRSKLEAIAKANGRSLNAEIALRLEESLQAEAIKVETPFTAAQVAYLNRWLKEELAKAGKG
jgi:hypothetical protein